MNNALKAFYDYTNNKKIGGKRESISFTDSQLQLVSENVVGITREMTKAEYEQQSQDPSSQYFSSFFSFLHYSFLAAAQKGENTLEHLRKTWADFQHLEALPAFGWAFYEHVLNRRCLGDDLLLIGELPDHVNYFFDFNVKGSLDLIYWQKGRKVFYMERVPFALPEVKPVTFGEEVKYLASMMRKAGWEVERCADYGRGARFKCAELFATAIDPRKDYPNAKVRALVEAQR